MTVRICEDTTRLLGVFYSQHGNAAWVNNPSLDGTHPIVYSAWDSHANFPTAGIVIDDTILNSPAVEAATARRSPIGSEPPPPRVRGP